MSRIKNELATRCELAMMGKVVPCTTEEAQAMTDYILTVLGSSFSDVDNDIDIIKDHLHRYSGENKVKYIVVNTLMEEFKVITYLLDDDEEPFPEDLATEDGVLCYVYNVTDPFLSEMGYCFFQKKEDQYYHRIG